MGRALKTLTSTDNGTEVKLCVGDQLALQLYENASTGYRWAFENLDEKLVAVRKDKAVSRLPSRRNEKLVAVRKDKPVSRLSSRRTLVGAGGPVQWTLEAKAAGLTEVKLKRWQQWRGEASVQDRFAVTLIISAARKRRTRDDAHP